MARRISHSTAKTIIYGGAAAIVVVLVVLVATVWSSDPPPVDDTPVRLPGAALPSTTAGGQDVLAPPPSSAPPSPPAPPLIEEHAGVWASVYYIFKTDPTPERDGTYRISHGSECELFHRCDPTPTGLTIASDWLTQFRVHESGAGPPQTAAGANLHVVG